MSRTVVWSPRASKDLGALDGVTQGRIVNAVQRYAESDYGDIRALTGEHRGLHRLRIGELRAVLRLRPSIVEVVRVKPRREAYR